MQSRDASPSVEPTDDQEPDEQGKRKAGGSGRSARACVRCNRSKLKCDGNNPCGRCKISDSACEYVPSMRGKTKRRRTTEPTLLAHSITASTSDDPLSNTSYRQSESPPPQPTAATILPIPSLRTAFRTATSYRQSLPPLIDRDTLTSLPLPGDVDNPLAVLAEATSSVGYEGDDGQSSSGPRGSFSMDPNARPGPSGTSGQGGASSSMGPPPYAPGDKKAYYARSHPKPELNRSLMGEAPHIMSLISPSEAEGLFNVYWKYLHPHLPCLDRAHSDPLDVASRSNFLFNAICCVSARSFDIPLWGKLKAFARAEMTRFPLEKTLDVVQGHLLYTEWNLIPAKRFEQDLTWIRSGMSVRTAIDINLHRVALLPDAKEKLPSWLLRSMMRTWLISFYQDRTLSASLGKPSSMRGESSLTGYTKLLNQLIDQDLAGSSTEGVLDDMAVVAWAEWTQILARALDTFRSGPMSDTEHTMGSQNSYPDLVCVFEKQFREWCDRSVARVQLVQAENGNQKRVIVARIRGYERYAQLILASYGMNRALKHDAVDLPAAFVRFQTMALHLINTFESDLENSGLARGCPDFVFTALTYAAVSLLKTTQGRYASMNDISHGTIFAKCRNASGMLSRAASVPNHLPALQSTFLARLLDIRTAETYSPSAIVPEALDLAAFINSVGDQRNKSFWPPSAAASPQLGLTPPQLPTNHSAAVPLNDVWNQNAISWPNTTPENLFNLPTTGSNAAASSSRLAVPDVPAASLGLTMGSFMSDASVNDMLFAHDAFWQSILEANPTQGNSL